MIDEGETQHWYIVVVAVYEMAGIFWAKAH